MSSNLPATITYSLEEFSRHGGLTGPHKDGWGIAYYVQGDVRLIKEPTASHDSACVRFIREHPFSSTLVLSHIRLATQGQPTMANCQPYVRELGGAMHVFAHNGHLDPNGLRERFAHGYCRPGGDTDSEAAFCALLARLERLWLNANGVPPLAERLAVVRAFAAELRVLGPANFLYADGDALFAHGHKRTHGKEGIRPPGLHVICRHCAGETASMTTGGLTIAKGPVAQDVVLVASVPLTAEPGWRPLDEGELVVIRDGVIVT